MSPATGYTGKNRLLAALPRDDFDRFFSGLEPVTLSFRQVLQTAGQPVEHIYFVEQGVRRRDYDLRPRGLGNDRLRMLPRRSRAVRIGYGYEPPEN
jgi:hypothetical protein